MGAALADIGHLRWLVAAVLILTTSCVSVQDRSADRERSHVPGPLAAGPIRQVTSEGENVKPFILARPGGGAYLAWARRDDDRTSVQFAVSRDGAEFGQPVCLSADGMHLDLGAESGPHAAVGRDGAIHVVWVAGLAKAPSASHAKHGHSSESRGRKGPPRRPGNLNIYLATSRDAGKTFSAPKKVNDDADGPEHRFPTVAVDARGAVCVAWLDKRNQSDARPDFARVYLARSTDGGRTFAPNVDATSGQEHGICHCCKLTLAIHPDAGIFIAFRDALDDVRDISIVRSQNNGGTFGKPELIENTRWVLPGCPMDGPSLAFDRAGNLHAVWMTRGNVRGAPAVGPATEDESKVLYRRFDPQKQAGSDLLFLAAGSHPRVAVDAAGDAYVVWKQDGLHLAQVPANATRGVQRMQVGLPETAPNYPSLATTPEGRLLVAWQQQDAEDRTQIMTMTSGLRDTWE